MTRKHHRRKTSNALELLGRLAGKHPTMAEIIEQERASLDIARKIYELRTSAGLSQSQLARKVRTTQSVISRLEDADYQGHSLFMLQRIAAALQRRVEIRFVPTTKKAA